MQYASKDEVTRSPHLASVRLKRWAAANSEEPIATDIKLVLEDLDAVRKDYDRDIATPPDEPR